MATVTLKEVRKVYPNGHVALERADFAVTDGEFLVLVGPSGCGKSTLLRMIAGLEEVSGGSIYIGEREVTHVDPRDRDIAMVFQSYALYPHMSVAENLGFGLKLRGHSTAEIAERVQSAATTLELQELLDRRPKQLSGGQRQRVALGRALVRKPQVFLLDEPLSNLDAKLRTSTRAVIAKLHRSLNTTMIYVTHDQVEAMTLGQRIVVLNEGVVQQIDTPMRIYARPVNLFVAGFLGNPSMNLLRGQLQKRAPGFAVAANDALFPLPPLASLAAFEGREVVVGVRPEDIQRIAVGVKEATLVIETVLELIEAIGNEAFLHLRFGMQSLIARCGPEDLPGIGATLKLSIDPDKIHYFDATTDQRLDVGQ
jgi:multiple sugar transport system ATP-binding protein